MKFNLSVEQVDHIVDIQEDIENKSKVIDDIVSGIIAPYCKDLDKYVLFIKHARRNAPPFHPC